MRCCLQLMLTLTAIVFAASLVIAQPSPTTPEPHLDLPDLSKLTSGRVTRVLDENTLLIEVDGKNTRYDLLGISGALQIKEQRELCADMLKRLLLEERVVIQHDPRGEFTPANRRAGYIFRATDTLFVNLELIRNGYARHTDAGMSAHLDAFVHAQRRAETLKLGIWDPDANIITLTDEPEPNTEPTQTKTQPAPATITTPTNAIYITPHGKKYHRKDCPHLTDAAKPTTREDIKDSHQPCKTCRPDEP